MCLAKAYFGDEESPFMEDVACARIEGNKVYLETLLGKKKLVTGQITSIDFSESRLVIAPILLT